MKDGSLSVGGGRVLLDCVTMFCEEVSLTMDFSRDGGGKSCFLSVR